jgi:Ku protein
VEAADIIKGYEVGKGQYLEIAPGELEAISIESKRTIEIDEFVPRKEIDELYLNSPYFIVPDGEVGQQAFAVIREAIRQEGMVAVGKVVFTSREHIIALEARGKGLLGVTLRFPYECVKSRNISTTSRMRTYQRICLSSPLTSLQRVRTFRSTVLRGPLRGRAQGAAPKETGRSPDRAARAR